MAIVLFLVLIVLTGCQSTPQLAIQEPVIEGIASWQECIDHKDSPQGKAEFQRKLPTVVNEANKGWLAPYVEQMAISPLSHLVQFQLAVQEKNAFKAQKYLAKIYPHELDESWLMSYNQSLGKFWRLQRQPVRELHVLQSHGASKSDMIKAMRQYPPQVLQKYVGQDNSGIIKAAIWLQDPWRKEKFHASFNQIAELLKQKRVNAADLSNNHYGLILPLSGENASMGQAIKDGFVSAFYEFSDAKSRLSFYDITSEGIEAIVKKGTQSGVTHWVGPLEHPQVNQLASLKESSQSVLAFNESVPQGVKSLSLSTHIEARLAAEHALQQGYRQALMVSGDTSWHQALGEAFAEHFQRLGGKVVESATFKGDVMKQLSQAVQLQSTLSVQHQKEDVVVQPSVRQDIDMVFLALNSEEAAQVKPMLRYLYAGHWPVYASSAVLSARENKAHYADLEGVQLFDWPWIHQSNKQAETKLQSMRHQLSKQHPQFDESSRLYAMGIDAFLLCHFTAIKDFPFSFDGASGSLQVRQGAVERSLLHAVIRREGLQYVS